MSALITNFDAVWIIQEYKNLFRKKGKMIWFSRDSIRLMNEYLKNNRSGVRIYHGKYPMHDNFRRVNGSHDYRGEKTIVFMPTIQNGTNHEDEISADEVRHIMQEIKAGNFPSEFAFNHGELCPPNCTGDTVEDNT
jgi:hypothetical protein